MRTGSIFIQIVALTLLVLSVAMALSLALVLITPPPEPGRITVAQMAHALGGRRSEAIQVGWSGAPPRGTRTPLVEEALARELGVKATDVRAVWKQIPGAASGARESIILIDGRDVLVSSNPNGFALRYGQGVELAAETLVPLFEAGVRQPDGNWRVGRADDVARDVWRLRIMGAFAGAALLLMGPAWLIARRIADPITALGKAASETGLNTDAPFPVGGAPEVRAAAEAMNAMHARLADQAQQRVRMLAAVAHDLRTPLTALRLRTDGLDEPMRSRMGADLQRMGELIDHSLEFALSTSRKPRRMQMSLDRLAEQVVGRFASTGSDVTMAQTGSITVETDPLLVERALGNLIDNALRYGARARVAVVRDRGEAVLIISDDGPGIPASLMESALRPFERLEPSRNREEGGSGLGLAIVADLTEALGGQLRLINADDGFRVEIRLPCAAEQDTKSKAHVVYEALMGRALPAARDG